MGRAAWGGTLRAAMVALSAAALLAVPGSAQERTADDLARDLREAQARRAQTVIRQARTPNDVAVNLHQLGSVIDHQDRTITRVRELSLDRAELREQAAATRASAEQRELEAGRTLAVVTRLRADAEALTREVAADEARQSRVLASLQADAAQQTALLAAVERDVAALGSELETARARRAAAGGFTCPVAPSWFQNDWGFPRSGGRSHQGTDVFADRGTPVVAVADGRVERVDATDSYRPGTSRGDLGAAP